MNERTEKAVSASGMRIRELTQCALFAAILCIFSPITIPIGPIPITMGIFAVMLTGIILGPKTGTISVLVYLLIGLCGLPLFSGGKSGVPALVGPTGGYIWSYLLMAALIGGSGKLPCRGQVGKMALAMGGCIVGTAVCYLCGTLQFMAVAGYSFSEALAVCVIPFVPFDLLKALCAVLLGVPVRTLLQKTGYLRP